MMSVCSNFVWTSTWRLPPPSVRRRPPEPDPLPLRVDVINGWSLTVNHAHCSAPTVTWDLLKDMSNLPQAQTFVASLIIVKPCRQQLWN